MSRATSPLREAYDDLSGVRDLLNGDNAPNDNAQDTTNPPVNPTPANIPPPDNAAPQPQADVVQAARAQRAAQPHTQTIAAPLYFPGNDPPLQGELTPRDFLRELDIRILGQGIVNDNDKLAFALNTLQGKAHEWYLSLGLRADFEPTFSYFRKRFAHKYRVPGHILSEFDVSLISKQNIEEDPSQYLARISNYVEGSAPAASFVVFTPADQANFDADFPRLFVANPGVKERIKHVIFRFGQMWANRIHAFHIRHIWLNGLLQPYADIARAQDADKELGRLVDKVQDEGAAKIQRAAYKDHAAAMRAYQARKGSNTAPKSFATAVDARPPNGTETTSAIYNNTRSSANTKKLFCAYCKKPGHHIEQCRKRQKRNSGTQSNSQQNNSPTSKSPASNKNPAMEALFKQWCSFVESKTNQQHQLAPPPAASLPQITDANSSDFF